MSKTFRIQGQKYRTHPAADAYPMMCQADLHKLGEDMTLFGQNFPIIITSDGFVLDGRNRLAACQLVGLEPWVEFWGREDDNVSPAAWVRSANDRRRHLNESQRAMVAAKIERLVTKDLKRLKKTEILRHVAKKSGASERSAQRAKALLKKATPEQIKAIDDGKKSLGRVEKELKRAEQVEQARAYVPPAGEYEVITVDFPWKYEDALEGKGMERGKPYPEMTIAEICAFIVEKLRPAENCALFAWVTNPILLDPAGWPIVAVELRRRWGFIAKQIRTWVKTNDTDEQVTKQGWVWRGDTEHLIRLERGNPVFMPTGANHGNPIQRTSFRAPIGEHSEKPAAAYMDIEHICASTSRLEMFARAPRKGWMTSGSELTTPAQLEREMHETSAAMLEGRAAAPTKRGKKRKLQPIKEIVPEGMGGPHDWQPVSSVQVRCSRCRDMHSAVAKPRLGCFNTPLESMAERMQRDQAGAA